MTVNGFYDLLHASGVLLASPGTYVDAAPDAFHRVLPESLTTSLPTERHTVKLLPERLSAGVRPRDG